MTHANVELAHVFVLQYVVLWDLQAVPRTRNRDRDRHLPLGQATTNASRRGTWGCAALKPVMQVVEDDSETFGHSRLLRLRAVDELVNELRCIQSMSLWLLCTYSYRTL